MKTITLLAFLTFVSVDGARTKKDNRLLIRQIIDSARTLEEDPQYAEKDVQLAFDRENCECKDFCVAWNILKPILPHHHKLSRALYLYVGLKGKDCPYTSENQYQLKELMDDIVHCAQLHNNLDHKQCPHNTTEH